MTTKPAAAPPDSWLSQRLPDPPKYDMEQFTHFVLPGVAITLAQHLDALRLDSPTLVGGNGYLCRARDELPSCPYPDMLVAFNVASRRAEARNGYVIEEMGKPPDLVLEVASSSTGQRDYIQKRQKYAEFSVPEYWRFDHTGGDYHNAALAADRLTGDGTYQPIEMTTAPDGVIWGYSEVLGLSVCWVEGSLRFWDRTQGRYLPDLPELAAELDSERQARADAEARANSEAQARADADARIRTLEAELRRRENS